MVSKKGKSDMYLFTKDKIVGNKKIIENMVLFLVLFIIVIVVINSLENKEYNFSFRL